MIAAERYAHALVQFSVEKNQLEQVYADMCCILELCIHSADLANFLESPVIKSSEKKKALRTIFEKQVDKITLTFIELMTDKKREWLLKNTAEAFIKKYKSHKNVVTAEVISAAALDVQSRKEIIVLAQNAAKGSSIELKEKVDKGILGGFILRMGDKQVDASVKRKLSDLRKTFTERPGKN